MKSQTRLSTESRKSKANIIAIFQLNGQVWNCGNIYIIFDYILISGYIWPLALEQIQYQTKSTQVKISDSFLFH